MTEDDGSEQKREGFSERLDQTVIDLALLDRIKEQKQACFDVIIEVNLLHPKGREEARRQVRKGLQEVLNAILEAARKRS